MDSLKYGLTLISIVVKLPSQISKVELEAEASEEIGRVVAAVMQYMKQNIATFFLTEYEAAQIGQVDANVM